MIILNVFVILFFLPQRNFLSIRNDDQILFKKMTSEF